MVQYIQWFFLTSEFLAYDSMGQYAWLNEEWGQFVP